MKAIIDIRALIPEKSGGIIQNIIGVLRALFSLPDSNDEYVIACCVFNRHLVEDIPGSKAVITLPLHQYYDQLEALRLKQQADVIFHIYPRGDCVDYDLSRRVFYIPDLQHEFFPEFFNAEIIKGRQNAFTPVLNHAGAIGTISEFSRNTVLAHPECRCADIFLMPPALQLEHAEIRPDTLTAAEQKQIPDGDFLFFPANLWPHKNHRRLFDALRLLSKRHGIAIPLVLTGAKNDWPALAAQYRDLTIRHLGYVRGELVSALLARATALCFFSLYEGFGIPLLEAFHAGTPVACSNTTSLPEIAGDAALYASPLDPEAMADTLHRLITSPNLRQDIVERGRQRLKLYSWKQSALNLQQALRRVARRGGIGRSVAKTSDKQVDARPLVSIITPSFNQARFIAATIDSVLGQTYDNIEYIVMDGNSTDGTVDILKRYDARVRWISEPDDGQTDAINKGMALAKGDILAYLNSDDVLEPTAIAEVVAYFTENPAVDMVYGEALYIDEDGAEIGRYNTQPYTNDALVYDCMICQPAAFWRRRIASIVGPFDAALHYAMDYDYWLRMRKLKASITHVPRVWARSRLHADTKTIGQRGKVFGEVFDVCRRHLGFIATQYFEGLWHYRLVESHPRMGPLIGSFPSIWRLVARLHRVIYFQQQGMLRTIVGSKLRSMSYHGSRLTGLIYNTYRRLRRSRNNAGEVPRSVAGFWADNWFSGHTAITYATHQKPQQAFLRGVPPLTCDLDITLNGKSLLHRQLGGGEHASITLNLPAMRPGDRLVVAFSKWEVEVGGRPLAFLADSTNLFAESDHL
ncbi:glycosyltransferase [Ferrovibrio sp. MS7]|uniref:glycosyltransferase n=1 Tax=Ferrovibrio plantarum TaxID=3119164 RepID=UPI00313752D5